MPGTAWIALGASVLALLAGAVAAVGPARGEHAVYSWPPAELPAAQPSRGWYAPLPLLNRVPAAIEITVPCALAPPLASGPPATVLATARHPQRASALWITLGRGALRIGVATSELATVPWPASCPLRLAVRDGALVLPTRTEKLQLSTLDAMPIVTGLFTNLDLRAGNPPAVVLETRVYATSQTGRQLVGVFLALALGSGVLLLLGLRGRHRRFRSTLGSQVRAVWAARTLADAVVVAALLVWWIVAPTFTDDGAIWVEQRAFDDLGTSFFYFNVYGLNEPLGYWLSWLQHWVTGSTNHLVFARIPSLLALLAAWPAARWCLERVVPGRVSTGIRWSLAGTFVLGATAWGMTLRPEPLLALLMLVNLAAMISFVRSPRLAPLVIALPVAALAATARPDGLLVTAPLLASLPEVTRWLRTRGWAAVVPVSAAAIAGLAVGVVAFTLDADMAGRLADARATHTGSQAVPWWREYIRYVRFDQHGGATTARRLSLALYILVVVAWATRRQARWLRSVSLPARCVVVVLVLLAFIPSKWPWHFGALLAVGAVAIAAEVARIEHERDSIGTLPHRRVATGVALAVASIWAWQARGSWGALDLQEASWHDGFNGVTLVALALVVGGVSVVTGWRRFRRRDTARGDHSHTTVGWAVSVVSFAVVGITVAVMTIDATLSPWSPARQNIEALASRESCGLAQRFSGGEDVITQLKDPGRPILVAPSLGMYFPCPRIPRIRNGLVETPSLVVLESSDWMLRDLDAPFAAFVDLYRLRAVGHGPLGVRVMSVVNSVPGFARTGMLVRIRK